MSCAKTRTISANAMEKDLIGNDFKKNDIKASVK